MRSYPIDVDRVRLISTGTVAALPKWVELSDGSKRPDPQGRQDVDEQGRPRWKVEVIAPADEGDDRDKTGVIEIVIASHDRPDPGAFGDLLVFEALVMQPGYLNKKSQQLTAPRWSADGIRPAKGRKAPASAADPAAA